MSFSSILEMTGADVPNELPVPQGSYRVVVEPVSRENAINIDENFTSQAGKTYLKVDIRVRILEPLDDVDPASLDEYNLAMGPISGASLWHSFFVDTSEEGQKAAIRRFFRSLRAFFSAEEIESMSLKELLENLVGRQAIAVIEHQVYNEEIRARVSRFLCDE